MEPPTERPTLAAKSPLDAEFELFGDRVGRFVRSLLFLAEFKGDLSNYVAEPNLRIVRSAFGKWSVDLLLLLSEKSHRPFGELRRALPKVSARVLSRKLQMLEAAGLVERDVVPSRPPRPEYALTDRGVALVRTSAKVLTFVRATAVYSRAAVPPPRALPREAPKDDAADDEPPGLPPA
jgi:DNA-binding HxlR family transcriptional regulator